MVPGMLVLTNKAPVASVPAGPVVLGPGVKPVQVVLKAS